MYKKIGTIVAAVVGAMVIILTGCPGDEAAELVIESWRNDDLTIWEDQIIPAFNARFPDIAVSFAPTAPAEYNAALNAKLQGGTAGDLITARPFDASLALYEQGYFASLSDLPGLENFSDVAKSAWITDDGSAVFAVPMASVIHGFIYNRDIFDELDWKCPPPKQSFCGAGRDSQRWSLCAVGNGHSRPVGGGHDGVPECWPQLLARRARTAWAYRW